MLLRRWRAKDACASFALGWPIEDRYARFQWAVLRHVLTKAGIEGVEFVSFWPAGYRFALVLTHDIETANGQEHARRVADLEEGLGFRSSFNFVPEGYPIDAGLVDELRQRGFEIGVHGLKHDGKLFLSRREFRRRAEWINHYLKAFGAVGFRAPLTHRQPEWMQELDVEYDLSFFDTDPFEPLPGGVMSIWPYMVGRFVELPYTLAQDYTLTAILGETTPRLWLQKVDFLERYCGLALLNAHPDYLQDPGTWRAYADFLEAMKRREGYWQALPRDVARWWRVRAQAGSGSCPPAAVMAKAELEGDGIAVRC